VNALADYDSGPHTGKIVIAGEFTSYNGIARYGIARLNADGTLDTSFDPGAGVDGVVWGVAILSDGKTVLGGSFRNVDLRSRPSVARLNTDGSLDTSFDAGTGVAGGPVHALAALPDGGVLIGGDFTSIQGQARSGLARLGANGTVNLAFNAGVEGEVDCLAIQSDGRIVLGGDFVAVAGHPRSRIARLNSGGDLDLAFNPGTGANGTVRSVLLLPDGKLVMGGAFSSVNGVSRHDVARLNTDGSLDLTLDPGAGTQGGRVNALALQGDGAVVLGGLFSVFNGLVSDNIARLSGDSSTPTCRLITSLCPRTGQPQVMVTGPIGARVLIEAASDLRSWTPLMTVTNTLSGVQVCDPTANGSPQRFYRARRFE
jgi:uncharacterized delta-60 repeat protein